MSDLTDAATNLSNAATRANKTTDFFDDVTTLGPTSTVKNPNNNKTVPSVQKQVKDLFDSDSNKLMEYRDEAEGFAISAEESADSVGGIIDRVDALEENQQSGVVVFQTYALLNAYSPANSAEEKGSFKVVNDSDSSLNGYYAWVSDTTYIKNADLVENTIDANNTSDAVSGKAVYRVKQSVDPVSQLVSYVHSGSITQDDVTCNGGTVVVSENGDMAITENIYDYPTIIYNPYTVNTIEFDQGDEAFAWQYLAVAVNGGEAVFFGIRGGAFGSFFRYDGQGNFTNIETPTVVHAFVGLYCKVSIIDGIFKLWQKGPVDVDYTLIVEYDLYQLDAVEIPSNICLGWVYNPVTNGTITKHKKGAEGRPKVLQTPDLSNTFDSFGVAGAAELESDVQSNLDKINTLASYSVTGKLVQSDVAIVNGGEVTVNDGSVAVLEGDFPYPTTIITNSLISIIEYETSIARYVLVGFDEDTNASIIVSIDGGGTGSCFKFVGGETFSNLGSIVGYNSNVSTNYIRQTLADGVMLIEGKGTAEGSYSKICEFDYSLTGSEIGVKSLGWVSSTRAELAFNCTKGYKQEQSESEASSNWDGLSWVLLGDSITASATYVEPTATELGISSYQNLGEGGATVINQGYATPVSTQYLAITGDPELITVFGGTNDFGNSLPLGGVDSTGDSTFYGALKGLAVNLVSAYPTSRVFFMTILHRDWTSGGQVAGLVNNNGDSIEDFNDAIRYVAGLNSIPVIDLYKNAGISVNNIDTYTSDRLHPNSVGGQRLADVIANVISNYKN